MDLRYSSINNTGFTISIRLAGFFIAKVQTAFKITDSQTITFEMQMNIKRKKWLVNIDRYISWFYRMPATFRLWWRTDKEGTGARRWTEVPRFWGWPTSWSPKRIYHTTTTLCCSLSKLTDDTYILALCANKDFIPNFVKCTYWLWTNKEEIIINIHLLIIIIRDRKMRK